MKCTCKEGECTCGRWAIPLARIFIGLVFVFAGFGKLMGFDMAVGQVAAVFPAPQLFTVLAIIFEFGGGLLIVSGFHARMGAYALIVFTVLATFGYHMGSDTMSHIQALKNLSIIGGLIYVAIYGTGPMSLAKWDTKVCPLGKMCPDCKVHK